MIGVGAPWILGGAVVAALATCVLHFISVRHPPVLLLPTMRFLPERPVRAVSRSARPSDLLLLLLRVAALLLIGVALGGLYWRAAGVKHGRVVVIQREENGDAQGTRDAVANAVRGDFVGDTSTRIVVMDSVAHLLTAAESQAFKPETLSRPALGSIHGSIHTAPTFSAAILAATRAAGLLVREERNIDAVDLVIVAPFAREWKDAALPASRAAWPGAIRFSASRSVVDSVDPYKRRLALVGAKASDAVQSALEARGWMSPNRGAAANAAAGANSAPPISIEWPASGTPEGWTTTKAATVGAVVARGEAIVFPFARTSHVPDAILAQGRALAWWSDGEVAAVEIPTATSCTRHVGIPVPSSSDVLQGQAARALLFALSGPCGGERDNSALSEDEMRALAGTGPAAPASAFKSAAVVRTPWAAVLLILALVLLAIEWIIRDREDRVSDNTSANADPVRRVA